ncbi:hypothetical protein BGZ58_000547 [Dissophora ornata]|nr:hypothetical protein BGZ58_000547 [Dissophora ornata]
MTNHALSPLCPAPVQPERAAAPLTISIPSAKTAPVPVATTPNPMPVPAPILNSIAALKQLEAEDDYDDSGNKLNSVDHYTYHGANNYTVQPFISEPETPSPILSAWSAAQMNPDYLVPYHPSLHKSIRNWTQIVLGQIRQRGAEPDTVVSYSIQAALSSTVPGIAAAVPSALKGISTPSTELSQEGGKESSRSRNTNTRPRIEKHFLFQSHHHREPHGQNRHCAFSTNSSTQPQPKKSMKKVIARPFKKMRRFFKRLISHPNNTVDSKLPKDKQSTSTRPTPPEQQPPPAISSSQSTPQEIDPTDPSLQYLSVSEEESGEAITRKACEQERPQQYQVQAQAQQPAKPVSKMMKFIDMIKDHIQDHHHHDHEVTTTTAQGDERAQAASAPAKSQNTAATSTVTSAVAALQRGIERARGPRMHPKLLELYEITDHVLGVGTFATVKEIKLRSTGQSFALKIILKKTIQGKGAMLDTEIAVLSKVRHPNCISLLEMFETEDAVYLVTDLAAGGELFDQLLKKGSYTEGDAARLVREILLGVEYLHSVDIVHRDLKPENLLFLDKSENARLMITDFGLSKVLTSGNDVLMTACGTPGYVAPEVLEQVGHGKPVDMWGVGIIAFTLLCGYTPFWGEDQSQLFENIIAGNYNYDYEYWKDISPLAKSFIDSLLVRPAERRATATQALSHAWFRAMLDQDLLAPASPSDSINLLPGVRKNFNARSVFKKAVRAVGILRKMQATQNNNQSHDHDANLPSQLIGPNGEDAGVGAVSPVAPSANETPKVPEGVVSDSGKAGPSSLRPSFPDVVNAAILSANPLLEYPTAKDA